MNKTAGIINRVAVWIILHLCVFGNVDVDDYMLILPDYEITEMSPICNHVVYLAGSQPYPFVVALNASSMSVLWKTSPDTFSTGTRIRSIWCHETEAAETSGVIIVGDTSDGFNNYKVTAASEGFAASLESTSGRILWTEFVSGQKETSLRSLTTKTQADRDHYIVAGVYNSQIASFHLSTSNYGKSFVSMEIDLPVFSPGSEGSDIAQGDDGNLYLMGSGTSKIGPGDSFEGVRDVFLIKINGATDEVIAYWSYGSPFYDECYSMALFEGFSYFSCISYGDFSNFQSDTIGSGLILKINTTDGRLESYYQGLTSSSKTVVYKDLLLVNRTLYVLGTELEDGISRVTLTRFDLGLNLRDITVIGTSKSLRGFALSYNSRSKYIMLLASALSQKTNGFQYYDEFSDFDPADFSIIRTFFLEGLENKALSQYAPNTTILLDQVIGTASITSTRASTTATSLSSDTPGSQDPIRDRVSQDDIPVTLIVVVSVFASLFFAMLVILAWITFFKSKNAGQPANNNIDGFMDSVGGPSTANMTSISVRNRGKAENTDFTAMTSPTVYKEMLQDTMPKAAIVPKMNVKNDKSSSSKSNSIEKTDDDKDSSGLGAPTVNLRQLHNQFQESSTKANDQYKGKNPAENSQQSAKTLPGENAKAAQSPVATRSVVRQNEKKSKADSARQDSASSNSSFPEKPGSKRDPKVPSSQAPVPLSALLAASKESGQPLESFLPPTKTESTGTNTNVTDIKALRNQKIEQTTLNLSTAVLGSGEVTAPSSRHTNYRAGSSNIPATPITVATLAIPKHLEMKPKDYAMNKVLLEKHGSVLYVGEGIKDNLKTQGRLLVVKVYRESKSAMSKEEFENFQKEVSIMHHVQEYPYFSKMLGYCTTPVALILKCYSRGSLDHWIFYPKWNKTKTMILSFALDIAEALAVLHKVGIVHFDIKPSSILLDADESGGLIACLGDFSSAQVADERTLNITSFNATANKEISIPFTSPEQLTRLRGVSEKTIPLAKAKKADVYSYGIVIFEMLTRKFSWT